MTAITSVTDATTMISTVFVSTRNPTRKTTKVQHFFFFILQCTHSKFNFFFYCKFSISRRECRIEFLTRLSVAPFLQTPYRRMDRWRNRVQLNIWLSLRSAKDSRRFLFFCLFVFASLVVRTDFVNNNGRRNSFHGRSRVDDHQRSRRDPAKSHYTRRTPFVRTWNIIIHTGEKALYCMHTEYICVCIYESLFSHLIHCIHYAVYERRTTR